MNSMNPWVMRRLAALRCEELNQDAARARAGPRRHRARWPTARPRNTPHAAPIAPGADVLARLAALVASADA